jgi:hypothetical protein
MKRYSNAERCANPESNAAGPEWFHATSNFLIALVLGDLRAGICSEREKAQG